MTTLKFFNRATQSVSVALNDGSTGFVRSKSTLEMEPFQVSSDVLAKVRKGFLVRIQVPVSVASKSVDVGSSDVAELDLVLKTAEPSAAEEMKTEEPEKPAQDFEDLLVDILDTTT